MSKSVVYTHTFEIKYSFGLACEHRGRQTYIAEIEPDGQAYRMAEECKRTGEMGPKVGDLLTKANGAAIPTDFKTPDDFAIWLVGEIQKCSSKGETVIELEFTREAQPLSRASVTTRETQHLQQQQSSPARVRLVNLADHPELNGATGDRGEWLPSGRAGGARRTGRYVVNVDGVGEMKIEPKNMELLDLPPLPEHQKIEPGEMGPGDHLLKIHIPQPSGTTKTHWVLTGQILAHLPGFGDLVKMQEPCDGGCGATKADKDLQKCARCKRVAYCCRNCQKKHWKQHKRYCKRGVDDPTSASYCHRQKHNIIYGSAGSMREALKKAEAEITGDQYVLIRDAPVQSIAKWLDADELSRPFNDMFSPIDAGGDTFLCVAARHDRPEVVDLLVSRGAKVDQPQRTQKKKEPGLTPVHVACESGSVRALQALIRAGASVTKRLRSSCKFMPLHSAIWNPESPENEAGSAACVRLLLEQDGVDPNDWSLNRNPEGKSGKVYPIHQSVDRDDPRVAYDMTRALLLAGADPNEKYDGGCALYTAARKPGHQDVCRLLIEFGARVNASNTDQRASALCYACQLLNLEVMKTLLELGANPNQARVDGVTPMCKLAENVADSLRAKKVKKFLRWLLRWTRHSGVILSSFGDTNIHMPGTPFGMLLSAGMYDEMDMLIDEHGIDINGRHCAVGGLGSFMAVTPLQALPLICRDPAKQEKAMAWLESRCGVGPGKNS